MKERPILFSGPMIRAIREGRKTQTRRIVKTKWLDRLGPCGNSVTGDVHLAGRDWSGNHVLIKCPYGQVGDRLWVKETHWFSQHNSPHPKPCKEAIGQGWSVEYAATSDLTGLFRPIPKTEERLRPSIHMPRWASRITLEIVSVRVERLNEISEEDAKAEGCEWGEWTFPNSTKPGRTSYKLLWESINGPGSWDANPWVWAVEFKQV